MIGCFLVQLGGHTSRGPVRGYAVIDIQDAPRAAGHRWSVSGSGYAFRREGARSHPTYLYLHRVVLGLDPGDPRAGDHHNGNTLDCRRSNLRPLTPAENAQNQPAVGHTSRYRGVSYETGRGLWRAQTAGRLLGRYDTELEAARAVRDARAALMPYANEDRHPVEAAA